MNRLSIGLFLALAIAAAPTPSLAGDTPTQSAIPAVVAQAAMKRELSTVRRLIGEKADVNAPQADGSTALHWAAYWDDVEMADVLLRAGAQAAASTRLGATPLYLAAQHGGAELVKRLLAAGADPNATVLSNRETPLMFAARSGSVDAVAALLDAGASVDARESLRETTALVWAAEQGHAPVVKLLLARGADPSAATKIVVPAARGRRGGASAAAGASAAGAAGGPPAGTAAAPASAAAAVPPAAAPVVPSAAAPPVPASAVAVDGAGTPAANARGGVSALMMAVRENRTEVVEALLDGGAPIDQRSGDGSTALLVATQNGNAAMAKRLIERGADVNLSNGKGWNPLYLAIKARTLEKGTMPNPVMDHDGLFEAITMMVEKGANLNARLKDDTEVHNGIEATWLREAGATPFLRAAFGGDLAVMKLLLAHGADPKIATEDGTTTLMAIAGVGYAEGFLRDFGTPEESLEGVRMLVDAGIDVNAKNSDQVMALHGAAHKNFVGAIQLLVEHGADLRARSQRASPFERKGTPGNTALDWASGVQVGMQSSIYHPEAVALVTKLMQERGLPVEALLNTKGGLAKAK